MVDIDDLEPIFGGPYVEHIKWFSKNENKYLVMLMGEYIDRNGIERFMNDCITYAQYVLYKEKRIILKPWEIIYYINRNMKDDRIENFKVIDTRSINIEVKYPYDPKEYNATINWHSRGQSFNVKFYPKNKFSFKKMKSLNIYIAETEKLKRFLNDDEKVIFIDGDRSNYNQDNLKVMKKVERIKSKYPTGEIPFQDYYIGNIFINPRENDRKFIKLYPKTGKKLPPIIYSRYRMQVIEGRLLDKNEEVDHIDANPTNDADDNLQILTKEEHRNKTNKEKLEMSPKIGTCCDGCKNDFINYLWDIRSLLRNRKTNNLFCSKKCKKKYIQEGNKIQKKELIKYTCAGTGREVYIPENSKFLPSKFNPDALPFYDHFSVLKWIRKYNYKK